MATCTATTRKGTPCKANALKGTDRCGAHPHDDAPSVAARSHPFGSRAQAREAGKASGEARRAVKPMEVMRRLVEDNAVEILTPHFKTLGLELYRDDDGAVRARPMVTQEGVPAGARVIAREKDATYLTNIEDLGAKMDAAERMLDRVFGKPKQQTELTGAQGGPVEIVPVKRQGATVVELLKGTGAVREDG